jgi:hypothetical protein
VDAAPAAPTAPASCCVFASSNSCCSHTAHSLALCML